VDLIFRFCLFLCLGGLLPAALSFRGADIPWTTYEAEDMVTTGEKLGPKYDPNLVETESSGQQCVKLAAGQYVEFTAKEAANALVVRYSLLDAEKGGGIDSTIGVWQNGKLLQKLPVTSRYSWVYGKYPFSNDPQAGAARNYFDEVRVKGLAIAPGDVLRLQPDTNATTPCIIDLVDLEKISAPLAAPTNSLSITDIRFGAVGDGETDATEALKKCIAAARNESKSVWVPAGDFKLAGDVEVPSGMTIQGAGMWHTTFIGDPAQYGDTHKRIRFNGAGSDIHLADFAIVGRLNYRKDTEPNDGIGGWLGENSTIARLWIEHTKTGMWLVNSSNLVVEGCRVRDTMADGVNFCVGMSHSTITNCTTRGTGDDGFAIWPTTYLRQKFSPGNNVISHCTARLPFLANGAAVYGGESNRIEDCRFTDITAGCGILISTTFPTANPDKGIDNNFSGTTIVQDCDLVRCGGYDHSWRAALQICLDRRSISGVDIHGLNIKDSISDGFSVIAPGSERGQGTLTHAALVNVNIPNFGIGVGQRHGLWIRNKVAGSLDIRNSTIVEQVNDSTNFIINQIPSVGGSQEKGLKN